MVERGEDFGFALKARKPILVPRDGRRQNLEGDLSLQLRVRGAKQLAHTSFADLGGNFVDAEMRAWSKSQSLRIIEAFRSIPFTDSRFERARLNQNDRLGRRPPSVDESSCSGGSAAPLRRWQTRRSVDVVSSG